MLTRNFYNLIGTILQSSASAKGTLPVTDLYGMQYFATSQYPQFPYSRVSSFTLDAHAAGISLGSDASAPSETDFNLRSTISSGINVSVTAANVSANEGDPYLQYNLTVTNTSSENKNIGEIGYKQNISCTRFSEDTSADNYTVLLDRTIISPPVTLAPGEAAVIRYRMGMASEERTVNGVKIVSWQYGSDQDVAAMIDAAHDGVIDLKADAGWQVGDMRAVTVSQFSSGGVTNDEQVVDLTITSFDDYNGCGCVMQVDFAEALSSAVRMHSSNTNSGGYGSSEVRTVTLPSLADAMPEWISSRFVQFNVLVSEGSNSSAIVTVGGNKLALRSEVEVRGSAENSKPGEGSPVEWYQLSDKTRLKRRGRSGDNSSYLLRSPSNSATSYVYQSGTWSSSFSTMLASSTAGIAPFFCL